MSIDPSARHLERNPITLRRILALLAERPDTTIEELRAALGARGLAFGYGTLHRFLERHGVTRKKRPPTRPSRTAPTS